MAEMTVRELKARSRIGLISSLSPRDSLLIRTALQKLISAEKEIDNCRSVVAGWAKLTRKESSR